MNTYTQQSVEMVRLHDGSWAPLAFFRSILWLVKAVVSIEEFKSLVAAKDWQMARKVLHTIVEDAVLPDDLLELAVAYTIAHDCHQESGQWGNNREHLAEYNH